MKRCSERSPLPSPSSAATIVLISSTRYLGRLPMLFPILALLLSCPGVLPEPHLPTTASRLSSAFVPSPISSEDSSVPAATLPAPADAHSSVAFLSLLEASSLRGGGRRSLNPMNMPPASPSGANHGINGVANRVGVPWHGGYSHGSSWGVNQIGGIHPPEDSRPSGAEMKQKMREQINRFGTTLGPPVFVEEGEEEEEGLERVEQRDESRAGDRDARAAAAVVGAQHAPQHKHEHEHDEHSSDANKRAFLDLLKFKGGLHSQAGSRMRVGAKHHAATKGKFGTPFQASSARFAIGWGPGNANFNNNDGVPAPPVPYTMGGMEAMDAAAGVTAW